MRSRAIVPVLVLVLLGSFSLLAPSARALPQIKSASDEVDDATITLWVVNRTILGDSRSWCQVNIRVTGSDVSFKSGDQIFLWVKEDDPIGDEELWSTSFTVTAAEVSANLVDRTFDCSTNFGDDHNDDGDYYAEARVEKDNCGFGCVWDRPETSDIVVPEVTDDTAENDDTSGAARPLGLGTTYNRIARDQDWFSFELAGPSQLEISVQHLVAGGRLDLVLYDSGGSVITNGSDRADETRIYMDTITAGLYRVRVSPRNGTDYNDYDIRLTLTPLATDCTPGETQSRDCGNCGTQSRSCTDLGRWTVFGDCTGEGECQAGSESTDSCGLCGLRRTICDETCTWVVGDCEDEGPCEPGTVNTESCGTDLERSQLCLESCQWGEWSECGGTQCETGDTLPCYTGPAANRGIGACVEGAQECISGLWGDCYDDVHPTSEICGDFVDNDCDGYTDADDPSCAVVAGQLGDPCVTELQCITAFECLVPPENDMFTGGYCSIEDCVADSECGPDGFCGYAFGQRFCLKPCSRDSDCRDQYVCADAETGNGCLPMCDRNPQCADPDRPICDRTTGICVPLEEPDEEPEAVADTPPDVGPDAAPDAGPDATAEAAPDAADAEGADAGDVRDEARPQPRADASCGCDTAAPGAIGSAWWLVLLAGLAWAARRRRA